MLMPSCNGWRPEMRLLISRGCLNPRFEAGRGWAHQRAATPGVETATVGSVAGKTLPLRAVTVGLASQRDNIPCEIRGGYTVADPFLLQQGSFMKQGVVYKIA